MDRTVGGHGVQERDIIDTRGKVREQIADPLATIPVLLEVPRSLDNPPLGLAAATTKRLHINRLAIHPLHRRLVIERVDVTRAAVHIQEDDTGGLGVEMRILGRQRIDELRLAVGRDSLPGQEIGIEQARESQAGESGSGLPEEFTAGAAAETAVRGVRLCHGITGFAEEKGNV